jgi:hypothetical protein
LKTIPASHPPLEKQLLPPLPPSTNFSFFIPIAQAVYQIYIHKCERKQAKNFSIRFSRKMKKEADEQLLPSVRTRGKDFESQPPHAKKFNR